MRKPVKNPRKPKPVLPSFCAFCNIRKTRLVHLYAYEGMTLESKSFTDVCITPKCTMSNDLSLVKSWGIYTGPMLSEDDKEPVVAGAD